MLDGRSAPSLSCNRNEKSLLFEDSLENDRSLDLSGLVIFGSDEKSTPEFSICFKNIQINSQRMTVKDIKMSSQIRLGCASRRKSIESLTGKKPEKGKMIIRKPVEITVEEGKKVSVKEFIPTLLNGKPAGNWVTRVYKDLTPSC